MDDSDDDVRGAYLSAIETFERVEAYLRGNSVVYPMVLQELQDCCSKIDNVITLESGNSNLIIALFQLKEQMHILMNIVEEKVKIENTKNTQAASIGLKRQLSSSSNPSNNAKRIKNDNDDLFDAVKNTISTPRCSGLTEIIGLCEIKKTLKSLVILPKTQPQLFEKRRLSNTILLFGPPGTGKTRLVHAIASEADLPLHCITASDILSQYVGETEKTIKGLFQYLKANYKLAILFIDEMDGFCRKRNENEQEHTRRIKTELMCQLSDVEGFNGLFVICATNCPWDLDSAILRRFQRRIYVPLPTRLERLEFFKFLTRNDQIENFRDWTLLLDKTKGFSGSDLCNVVQTALHYPLRELDDTKVWKLADDGFYEPALREEDFSNVVCSELRDLPPNSVRARKVQMIDFLNAVENANQTVSVEDVRKYDCFNNGH